MFLVGCFSLGLCLSACAKAEAPPAPAESGGADPRRVQALFYYDLGPATVDVSAYPREQQENYRLFLNVCGACHSAARPLNAPYDEAAVWKRFVNRMHVKMESQGISLVQGAEGRILEFLIYDSKARKIEKKEVFQSQQQELKTLFQK